jgi:hypothetical protein
VFGKPSAEYLAALSYPVEHVPSCFFPVKPPTHKCVYAVEDTHYSTLPTAELLAQFASEQPKARFLFLAAAPCRKTLVRVVNFDRLLRGNTPFTSHVSDEVLAIAIRGCVGILHGRPPPIPKFNTNDHNFLHPYPPLLDSDPTMVDRISLFPVYAVFSETKHAVLDRVAPSNDEPSFTLDGSYPLEKNLETKHLFVLSPPPDFIFALSRFPNAQVTLLADYDGPNTVETGELFHYRKLESEFVSLLRLVQTNATHFDQSFHEEDPFLYGSDDYKGTVGFDQWALDLFKIDKFVPNEQLYNYFNAYSPPCTSSDIKKVLRRLNEDVLEDMNGILGRVTQSREGFTWEAL